MSSLRKISRSPFWIACITLPNGRRTSRSTGILIDAPTSEERKEQKEKAQDVALKWERAGRRAKRGLLTKDQARDVLNDILHAAGVEPLDVITTRAFLRSWLEGKLNRGTRERYRRIVDLLLTYLGPAGDLAISRVSYQQILAYLDWRRKEKIAPKTLKVEAKCLGVAFNLARRLGHVEKNPVDQALALQPITTDSSEKGVFTPEQIGQLVLAAQGDWRTTVLLGYYTGARLRDCANLRFRHIDWDQQIITVQQRKTGKPAWIPIHPCLFEQLSNLPKGGPDDFVCPTLANRRTGGKTGLSRDFSAIMVAAGIDCQMVPGKGRRRFSKLSFHALRHSFNSHLANLNVDQETRQVMTGQATVKANKVYTHLDLPKLRGAIGLLPNVVPTNGAIA